MASPANRRNVSPIRTTMLGALTTMGYEIVKPIGKGSFGQAFLVEHMNTRKPYVAKLINMTTMTTSERKEAHNEIRMLQKLEHPHIVRYIDYVEDRNNLIILMEYADGGDIAGYISRAKASCRILSEKDVMTLFTQTCLALKHMHDRRMLHRDIKMQNIFLTKDNTVKLGDFGISTVLKSTMAMAQTVCGTPYYFSPELCAGEPYNNKSDIWALGVLLYNLCTGGEMPFDATSMKGLMEAIVKRAPRRLPAMYGNDIADLVNQALAKKSRRRPNIDGLLSHPAVLRLCPELVADLTPTNTLTSLKNSPPISPRSTSPARTTPQRRQSSPLPPRPVGGLLGASPQESPQNTPRLAAAAPPRRVPVRIPPMRAGNVGGIDNGMRDNEAAGLYRPHPVGGVVDARAIGVLPIVARPGLVERNRAPWM